MANPIGAITGGTSPAFPLKFQQAETPSTGNVGFQQLLQDALQSTASMQNASQQAVQTKVAGGEITTVEVMADLRQADLALKLMLQIRNKLLEGFNEIKQMQF